MSSKGRWPRRPPPAKVRAAVPGCYICFDEPAVEEGLCPGCHRNLQKALARSAEKPHESSRKP